MRRRAFRISKTHYYGGIKKYQWAALPLALHGAVMTESGGRSWTLRVGEAEGEPVFFISDLMPHLAKDQYEKKLGDAISGEGLNIINGSLAARRRGATRSSSEVLAHAAPGSTASPKPTCAPPSCPPYPRRRRSTSASTASMIAAYGQDDRVCAYPSLTALFETKAPSAHLRGRAGG